MRIVLSPGEEIHIGLAGSDGDFVVKFDHSSNPGHLTIEADIRDSTFQREGVIYDEDFNRTIEEMVYAKT